MKHGGRFETQVYRDEATDQFLIVDYYARPTVESWVMIKRLSAIEIIIEPFHGQTYLGVVRMLEFYRLPRSEQKKTGAGPVCPD